MIKKVLFFLKRDGLMDRDMAHGFVEAGMELKTEVLHLGKTSEGHTVQMFSSKAAVDLMDRFKPDMVFSFNGYGSDNDGFLAGQYARRGIPFVTWFVDMPKRVNIGNDFVKPNTYLFVFDATDIVWMKRIGFDHVYHLPLATNPDRFRILDGVRKENTICFVGDSNHKTIQYLAKNIDRHVQVMPESFYAAVERAIECLLHAEVDTPERLLWDSFSRHGLSIGNYSELVKDLLEAFVEREASLRRRLDVIRRLHSDCGVVVYGDGLWREVVGTNHRGKVNYFNDDIVETYNRHTIHINISKFQLRRAINQRPFDVSACGGFLLTDGREDLRQLFGHNEMVSYASIEDLLDKIAYFRKNDAERQVLAENARRKTINCHTYKHRVVEIVKKVSGMQMG
jgi:spore maturation protein CgeB